METRTGIPSARARIYLFRFGTCIGLPSCGKSLAQPNATQWVCETLTNLVRVHVTSAAGNAPMTLIRCASSESLATRAARATRRGGRDSIPFAGAATGNYTQTKSRATLRSCPLVVAHASALETRYCARFVNVFFFQTTTARRRKPSVGVESRSLPLWRPLSLWRCFSAHTTLSWLLTRKASA